MSVRLPHCVFIHIPRTGGLWVQAVIERLGIKCQILKGDIDSHLPVTELPEHWQTVPAFSFVRHPWEWVKSRWSHALELDTYGNYRHYGIHREFDECVRPSFQETLAVILSKRPGIVGETYSHMLQGVEEIRRTIDLPYATYEMLVQYEIETVDSDKIAEVIAATPKFNSTSGMEKYREQFIDLPAGLTSKFLASEKDALKIWQAAPRIVTNHPKEEGQLP